MKGKETVWILMFIGIMGNQLDVKAVFKKKPSFERYCELTDRKLSVIIERDDAETIIAEILREMNGSSITNGYILSEEEVVDHHREEP